MRDRALVGYEWAASVAYAAIAHLPPQDECFAQILKEEPAVAAAFLTHEYFSEKHFHDYNMKERLFDLLVKSDVGRAPLGVIGAVLKEYGPGQPADTYQERYHQRSVAAARKILGGEFPAWYQQLRGISYEEDQRRDRHPDAAR